MNMKLTSPVAGSSGSTSADLRTQPDAKKRDDTDGKFSRSWGSKMESEASSMSDLSDLENIKNTITEETSYANSDTSIINDIENDITSRKTCICTYVLS
ncbi:hypothetical protein G9A89_006964 [Geosiphon pyriformis]|nr:hypothetical protein G9A89_006964 [Geosiphon pyriformis]